MKHRSAPCLLGVVALTLAPPGVVSANIKASIQPNGVIVFNQELPSGKDVVLELAAPGQDEAGGTLQIWPYDGSCAEFPTGAHQARELGLGTAGTGNDRLLTATVSPLQIQTNYCVVFNVVRGLPDDKVDALAQAVGDIAARKFDWATQCQDTAIEEKVAAFVEAELKRRLSTLQISPGATPTIDDAQVKDAATLITSLADVRSTCRKVGESSRAIDQAHHAQAAANQALGAAAGQLKSVVTAPATVFAWPPAIPEEHAPFSAVPLVDALARDAATLARVATRIEPADDASAADLRALTTLTGTALADAIRRLQERYKRAPATGRELVLFLPSRGAVLHASELSQPAAYSDFITDVRDSQDLIQTQLRQIAAQSGRNLEVAGNWKRAITALFEASRDVDAGEAELSSAEGKRDELAATLRSNMVDAVRKESVRRLLRMTTRSTAPLRTARPADTDDKASWISPTFGAMVAFPLIHDDHHTGLVDPWLVPYAGASIYFRRVDRVIDLDDLVGDTWWQRNSFSVGVWLNKPDLNGKGITGIWSTGQVPFVAFGHRMTQYLRVDAGVAFFDYTRRLPILTDKATGVALWIGTSLDADVWGVVKDKVK